MELALIARHGQSLLNVQGLVNGDPERDLGLSELGRQQAAGLGRQIAAVAIDLCVTSSFPRAQQTADGALAGRDVPRTVDGGLNDIRIGELEGRTLDDYRAWKHAHTRDDAFPGGESLNGAARRYAGAFERVLERPEAAILVVCHSLPVAYLLAAREGAVPERRMTPAGNAALHVFTEGELVRAAAVLEEWARTPTW